MTACARCGNPAEVGEKLCASCLATPPTRELNAREKEELRRRSERHPSASSGGIDEGRFPPGTVLADRYRISGLLGRGGMGEVYRAVDLTLDQEVALKFLPPGISRRPASIARFYNEVKIARQVSHPNVCRVYDIGESDGLLFLSMEYIDGEDLRALLRRIGRLPIDKATEIARKLCAGLAAAHEKGILHRDLKPANIMLDGKGHVHIMDFGLAGLAERLTGDEVRNGTPAYMSPEQLAGREVTARSDIYSLGVVLYEIFTGKRPFSGDSRDSAPAGASIHVKDIDPAAERAISRCLATEPAERPSSALAVAASLAGGNALAEVLAAGETPSPAMVAASGGTEGIAPRTALILLLASLSLLPVTAYLTSRANAPRLDRWKLSPDVLAEKARDISTRLGYPDRLPYWTDGIGTNTNYQAHLRSLRIANAPLVRGPEQEFRYFWRESPSPLVPENPTFAQGFGQPAQDTPGMIRLRLDAWGNLLQFEAIPQPNSTGEPARPVDWSSILTTTGLDPQKVTPIGPVETPRGVFDTRASWTGTREGFSPGLRIEAAAWKGKVTWLVVAANWDIPRPVADRERSLAASVSNILNALMWGTIAFVGAPLLAWRNIQKNRADRIGALRLGLTVFAGFFLMYLLRARYWTDSGTETLVLGLQVGFALFFGVASGLIYVAIEPWIRRRDPTWLVTWTRVVAGQFRDALVGRDILLGGLAGLLIGLLGSGDPSFQYRSGFVSNPTLSLFVSSRLLAGTVVFTLAASSVGALGQAMVFQLLRTVVRSRLGAAALLVLVLAFPSLQTSANLRLGLALALVTSALEVALLVRFGIFALFVAGVVGSLFKVVPITLDPGAWYSGASFFILASVAALLLFALRAALGGRPVFGDDPVH